MASTLRHRVIGGSKPQDEKEDTPEKAEEVHLAPVSKIMDHNHKGKKTGSKRRNGLVFFLGGLFGIIVAGSFAKSNDLIQFPEFGELSMDSFLDVLPQAFVKDARDLMVCHGNRVGNNELMTDL